jgi:GTP-binding protein
VAQPFIDARFLLSETDPSRLGPCAAEMAFVGRSNVGKSSLLNALCRQKLARTSNTPGRTRTINVFVTQKDRWIVDLPGYGYAQGSRDEQNSWGPMIEAYLTARPSLRLVLALIDSKVGPTKLDLQMLAWLQSSGLPWSIVATKCDQVKRASSVAKRAELAATMNVTPEDISWTSAEFGYGINELRADLIKLLKE